MIALLHTAEQSEKIGRKSNMPKFAFTVAYFYFYFTSFFGKVKLNFAVNV